MRTKMLHGFVVWILAMLVGAPEAMAVSGPHIADVNILLPPRMTNPVEYRLQGSDGCFQWSWDHHDILSVVPEYNSSSHCSMSARLRSVAPYSGRKETAVYAADVHSGIIVRCKVFIDNFSRIQIFHNSIKLDLDGLATLHVRAFDSEDNVFSSLVGLQFHWQLMPESDGSSHHLVHVPLRDSPLSDCGGLCGDLNIQIKNEESGVFSDLYVVKGVGIGHEIVSVHSVEPQLEHMEDKIVLTVAEAMSLSPPSPVLVLIGAMVHFVLKAIRGNVPQVVALPSPCYEWSVVNSSVALVDKMLGIAYALNLGVTTVIVEDTRVVGHTQMSSLHVVVPDNLFLYILPLSHSGDLVEGISAFPSSTRWHAILGHQYVIYMRALSLGYGAREIHITENDDVKLHYQSEYWKTFLVSDSLVAKYGWQNSRILVPTTHGLGKLVASLAYSSGHPDTKEVLKVEQEVMVCNQVKLSAGNGGNISQMILLPWAPSVFQEVELMATGGCAKVASDYKWFSSDMATVSVSATGVVKAMKPGKATVKVVSIFDSLNYDEVFIEASIPSTMVMLQNLPAETVVGSHLQAAVTMKASHGAYFYRCDAFNTFIRWKVGSESFVLVNATGKASYLKNIEMIGSHTSPFGPPCAWTFLYACFSGRAMLHATLSKEYQQYGPIALKTSSRIAAYTPLRVRQVGDGNQFGGYWFDSAQAEAHDNVEDLVNLHLVPGSQMDVMLVGGPERWDQDVKYVENTEIFVDKNTDPESLDLLQEGSTGSGSLYTVYCQRIGTFKLVFKRGNLVGDDHPMPFVAEAELLLFCSLPTSVVLIVDEPVNAPDIIWSAFQADHGPAKIRVAPITVENGRTIRVSAAGMSNYGKPFANSSSLCLSWELSNCDGLAYWDSSYNLEKSKSSWERFLALTNDSGQCVVRATVSSLIDNIEGHNLLSRASSLDALMDAVRLQLVSTLRIYPEFNLVFFSPDAKLNLSITGGSCFLDAVVNDSSVVEIIQPPQGLQCSQLVLTPKELGTTLVTVYDIGLAPPIAASSAVEVADVDWIKIISPEEISLMEGSFQSFNLLAGVSDGRTFDPSQYIYMNLFVHIKDQLVDLVDEYDFISSGGGYVNGPKFIIMAKNLGVTTLYVTAKQQSGYEIFSQPIIVEVYAPPKIHPENIILVPGASYVLTMKGGPTIGVFVEYASMDDETATIHKSSGQLSAILPGNTSLVAKVFGNGDTMICQAYAKVTIVVPSSMVLSVQSEQLNVGCEMPIYPSLVEGNLFSFYELCRDYKWTIEDEKILSFQETEHLNGDKDGYWSAGQDRVEFTSYMDGTDPGFINVLYGRSAGRTSVAVSFSCDFISAGSFSESRSYNASVSLLVVSDLPLALGVPITWILPPHYGSSKLLPSSESSGQLDSQNRKGSITYSLLRDCSQKKEELNRAMIIIDGGRIITSESNNLACIQAKDHSNGKTEVAACVRVAEVAQVRMTSMENPFHAIYLAVGAELKLPINLCDVLGNPFHEAYDAIQLDVEINYPDIVYVNYTSDGSGGINIKAARHGRALLRISILGSIGKSDYLMISVGARLYPQNPVLHPGSTLNFSIEGLNDEVAGQWLSANESVLHIDALSGNANAVGNGITVVIFEGSNVAVHTRVTVCKGNIIFVGPPQEVLTNIPFPHEGYNFSVKFSNSNGQMVKDPGNSEDFLYDCNVDPSYIGYAKPWRDLDLGNSYCLFFPYSPEHLVHSIPMLKDMKPNLYVALNASLRGASHVSGSATAHFIGGFSLLGVDKLNFTSDYNKSIITIVGNTDVEIHWHKRSLILVTPIGRQDFGVGGRAQFEVKVLEAKRFNDRIIMMLPAIGQKVEVEVNYEPEEKAALDSGVYRTIWATLFCFALLIVTVAVSISFLDKPHRAQSPTIAAPSLTPTATPDHGSSMVFNEQSSRTPPPFVDYVRRTLDETPHYTREGRRRFNPQNTF